MNASHGLKAFRRTLSRRIFLRFLGAVVLYTVAVFLLLGLAWLFYFSFGQDVRWINDLAHAVFGNMTGLLAAAVLVLAVGWAVLFFYYWNRTFHYLEDLVNATETVCVAQEEVSLPEELLEVERRLNDIQRTARRNARAAQEAEQKKNDLVVYLAHDLKTPLTSVIGYLTLLTDERDISPELRQKYLSVALDRAYRLEELINEFFDIARFSLVNLPLDPARIDLSLMLEQIVYEFRPMLQEKRLTCKLSAPPGLTLLCDANKIQRVFDNLLRNAVNYCYPDTEIVVIASDQADSIRVQVLNRGAPIRQDKLEHLFEQFYRLDSARATRTGGSGLGLAISREIVEQHGGTISAHCDGELISFTVDLPKISENRKDFMEET